MATKHYTVIATDINEPCGCIGGRYADKVRDIVLSESDLFRFEATNKDGCPFCHADHTE
ncbi:hypothetical protein [Alicyclobacillus shizuokensis]|uniref:hypothetical protein n=1 Tax=Alicyclobacillus shizuokensis TaxID=392014 RepID=UPI000A475AA1|nr:hypothetical protein [Alicyclobacillus shizuokensis]